MKSNHFISIRDLTASDVGEVFRLAREIKQAPEMYQGALAGKSVGILLESPSTRTRVSFQVGIYQMGGMAVPVRPSELRVGEGLADLARVFSRYVDALVVRLSSHADLVELAKYAEVPVINGLSDLLNPCQALADYYTLYEAKGDLSRLKIAYVGDGNHMCHSLMFGANKVGMNIAVASPAGYAPKSIIVKSATREAASAGVSVVATADPGVAVSDADAIYTDNWVPIGKEDERAKRREALAPFQVNEALMSKASQNAVFLHCLPANRGSEVTADVIDSDRSLVFQQVENRLHVQKAVLFRMLAQN